MRYLKLFCINVLTIIILISLFTTFYYFDFINLNIYNFIKLFILLLSICICSFILCKERPAKKSAETGGYFRKTHGRQIPQGSI